MITVEYLKEKITYYKLWLIAVIASFSSVGGWLVAYFQTANQPLIIIAAIIECCIILCVYFLNKEINHMLTQLKNL